MSHAEHLPTEEVGAVLGEVAEEMPMQSVVFLLLAAFAARGAALSTSPYPNRVYDAKSAAAYYRERPLEVAGR